MGSRIRENVKHFFECFCEVVPKSGDKEAWIIQKYPDSYKEEEVLKSVPKFAYPCHFENTIVQHYSFVLTDIESKWTFGFCRHDPKTETALVVLSYLPWHHVFYKFLNNISVLIQSPRSEDIWDFFHAIYNKRLSDSGSIFVVHFNKGESTFSCECPDNFKLPSIPKNRNLTEYYNAVDPNGMMQIFAAMLNERRIIFTSKRLYRLSACVQSANDIIYPMIWQHIFIPVLPNVMVDYLLAPMPFLIGVPYDVLQTVHAPDIGDVVILDADNNIVTTPFDDLNSLPSEIVSSLKRQLRNRSTLLGDGISRAFLRALVQLIGGYRDALDMQQQKEITFNPQAFIESRPSNMQPFLRKMLELQIFQQFIEERLQMLNKGLGFTDEFELEAHRYSEKSSSKLKLQYKEWTYTMKKEGTAFFKHVKDKANPAVKSAVKSVKESSKGMKSAYKGFRSKFRESQCPEELDRGMKVYGGETVTVDKPRSAPTSPTGKRRPMTGLGVAKASYRKEGRNFMSAAIDSQYSPLAHTQSTLSSPDSPERTLRTGAGPLVMPPMDLLDEMQDLLRQHQLRPIARLDTPPIDRSGEDKCEDLIRLDSTPSSEMDDFDPLCAKNRNPSDSPSEDSTPIFTKGLTNPLYTYFVPSGTSNGTKPNSYENTQGLLVPSGTSLYGTKSNAYENNRNDQDLLQEYGLDFTNFSIKMDGTSTQSNNYDQFSAKKQTTLNSQPKKWTTFE